MRLPLVCLVVAACDAGAPPPQPAPAPPVPPPPAYDLGPARPPTKDDLARYVKDIEGTGTLLAVIDTSLGTFHCDLFPDRAPLAVANFVGLATGKKAWLNPNTNAVEHNVRFYDGLTFHRVIPEFMIQGGDPQGRGTGGPGYVFANEISPQASMDPGSLAMANAGPGTNGSQFFIMENNGRPDLATGYTIFGSCHELDLVKKIARVPRNLNDMPETSVTITRVSFTRVRHYD